MPAVSRPADAGLGPEAQRMRGHTGGGGSLVDDVARDDIGQRHLGGGDQPPAIRRLVAVLAEFRQLAGAVHGLGSRTRTGPLTSVRPFSSVWMSSMNCASARCRRATAPEQDEAGAGELRGGLEIHARRDAGISKCSFGVKSKARGAPAVDLDIVVLVRAVGHVGVGQVGDAGEQVAQGGVLGLGLLLQPAISSFFSATSARRRSNSASSPWPWPRPPPWRPRCARPARPRRPGCRRGGPRRGRGCRTTWAPAPGGRGRRRRPPGPRGWRGCRAWAGLLLVRVCGAYGEVCGRGGRGGGRGCGRARRDRRSRARAPRRRSARGRAGRRRWRPRCPPPASRRGGPTGAARRKSPRRRSSR
jgi:hypothetical protein